MLLPILIYIDIKLYIKLGFIIQSTSHKKDKEISGNVSKADCLLPA